MPAVLVHGVPETAHVWEPLVHALGRTDVELLHLPGFGTPVPPGFTPDMESYASWLAEALADYPDCDFVGHDWGAILALRVLVDPPSTIRSWVLDIGNLDESFVWHDIARAWQTEGDGEAMMQGILDASTTDRAALLTSLGVPKAGALTMAAAFDETMASVILPLYRSATDIGRAWGPGVDQIRGNGLVIGRGNDPYVSMRSARELARRLGVELAELPEAGHWWMLDSPETAAPILERFWTE